MKSPPEHAIKRNSLIKEAYTSCYYVYGTAGLNITNLLQQNLDDLEVSLRSRRHESSQLVPVLAVDIEALLQVRLDRLQVAIGSRRDEPSQKTHAKTQPWFVRWEHAKQNIRRF